MNHDTGRVAVLFKRGERYFAKARVIRDVLDNPNLEKRLCAIITDESEEDRLGPEDDDEEPEMGSPTGQRSSTLGDGPVAQQQWEHHTAAASGAAEDERTPFATGERHRRRGRGARTQEQLHSPAVRL